MKKKEYPPKPPELYDWLRRVKPGKDARALHREMKKHGDSMPFYTRYPNFQLWVSVTALVVSVVCVILQALR